MVRRVRWMCLLPALLLAAGCGTQGSRSAAPDAGPTEKSDINWMEDYEEAQALAAEENRPMMVDVFATWCHPCDILAERVFTQAEVEERSKEFVALRVDADERRDLARKWRIMNLPTVLFLSPDGEELGRVMGAVPPQNMLDEMAKVLDKLSPAEKTAPEQGA